jgi:hypothetical protein
MSRFRSVVGRCFRPQQARKPRQAKLGLELLEDRTLLTNAFSAAAVTSFVDGLYATLLGRTPGNSEVQGWLQAVTYGTTPGQVAQEFLQSPEYRTRMIRESYLDLLHREPEPGIIQTWLPLVQSTGTYESVTERVLASPEYYLRQGGTPQDWVGALYQQVLGRIPEPSGLSAWLGVINAGESRETVARGFVASNEAHILDVEDTYHTVLGRAPENAGLTAWVTALDQGLTVEQFIADVVGSDEFAQQFATGQFAMSSNQAGLGSVDVGRQGVIRPFAGLVNAPDPPLIIGHEVFGPDTPPVPPD